MNIIDKYIPTTQKSLFHKDICSHIKKWITNIIENDFDDKKKILFLRTIKSSFRLSVF